MKITTLMLLVNFTFSSVISKSELIKCIATTENSKTCSTKLLVNLSIDNLKLESTDSLSLIVDKVTTENKIQNLKVPIKIEVKKSQVTANYSSTYIKDFNFRPRESVIVTDVFSCEDGDLSSSPTCGWVRTEKGEFIKNSQGFCCKCDFSQLIGIDRDSKIRGSNCDALSIGKSASAHCFRLHPLNFSSFSVDKPVINYTLEVIVNYEDSSGSRTETLTLSPSKRAAGTLDNDVNAKIIGDFTLLTHLLTTPITYSSFLQLLRLTLWSSKA